MERGRNASHSVVRQQLRDRSAVWHNPVVRALGLAILGSAAASAAIVGSTNLTVSAVGAVLAAWLTYHWVRLLVLRDARGLLSLWVVFAFNRTLAVVLPAEWSTV